MKITQTYTSTIRKANMNKMTQLLKQQGHITLIIINNTKKQEQNETEKIKQLKKLKNVNIKLIKENQIIKTLEKVIDEG
jgi:predicted nucleic acid-binding protein